MKPCSAHSEDLLRTIRRKGMGALVRSDRAAEFARKWLLGTTTKEEFDPYVVATLEIASKAKELSVYVVPGCCPLCTVEAAYRQPLAPDWIDNITDLMLIIARANALRVAA